MKLLFTTGTLKLREPFRISRSVMSERDAVTVCLEHEGVAGYGEVVTSTYYDLDVDRIATLLTSVRGVVEGCDDPEQFLRDMPVELSSAPGVLAALDSAAHDLVARLRGVPVHALVAGSECAPVPTARTIGITSVEDAARSARELTARGFRVLKLKLAAVDEEGELARLVAVRRAAPTARLLVDPNGAWEPEQALRLLTRMQDYQVEAVEQPIAPGTPDVLGDIAGRSPVPIIADEDAATVADVRTLGSSVHGVNIKLAKCGGLRAAREIIDVAAESGVAVMLGCLVASSLGIAPAVHLTGLARWVDLDGHLLLAHDPWRGIGGADGVLRLNPAPGLGVRPVDA